MIAENIHSFLFGKVRFLAQGGFPDLFLSSCAEKGAEISDIRKDVSFIEATADERNFKKVSSAASSSGMELSVVHRSGLPYFLMRYRRRAGIPIGSLIGVLIFVFLSGSIWEISVVGNDRIGTEEILDVVYELGIKRGARLRGINASDIERATQDILPDISWIAVDIIGCKVRIEIVEAVETPELTRSGNYSNIIAALDGVIVSSDVLKGTGMYEVGMPVVHGDLLVSGVIEMNNGACRFVDAKGIIKARTDTSVSAEVQKTRQIARPVKERDRYSVVFFGVNIPLWFGIKNAECRTAEYLLMSRKTVFPVGIAHERYSRFEENTEEIDSVCATLVCFSELCEKTNERYCDAELISRDITIRDRGGKVTAVARCICVEDIGRRQPFEVTGRE